MSQTMDKEKYIKEASEKFEALLREQIKRAEDMKNAAGAKDFAALPQITIGLCGGDGIGPIIMAEAERLLTKLLAEELASGKVVLRKIEGLTLENRVAVGKAVPDDVMEEIKSCDVILKGPTTTPKGGSMGSANVTLRSELDLYANVRPVCVPEEGIDWMFYRENTEGEYVLGSKGIEIPETLAVDFNVAIVTKANIMKKTDGNFSAICREVAADYPGIEAEDWYIDIMTANLVNKAIRNRFQVFVMPNLYGDIITDEAAEIQGGVGTAGSANIGDRYAMFEAIHGSAPRMIEEGLADYANPSSIFKATEMMLRHIGFTDKADKLAEALHICCDVEKSVVVTGMRDGGTCREFAEYMMSKL